MKRIRDWFREKQLKRLHRIKQKRPVKHLRWLKRKDGCIGDPID